MEKKSSYALMGLSALILFIGLIVFVVWLAWLPFNREYELFDIVFVGPVRGLSEGGEVHFSGIKVGEVKHIKLDKSDPNRVVARIRVSADVPIRSSSLASLEPRGITGVNYVQITAGAPGSPLLLDINPRRDIPVIRSQRSAISDLLQGGGTVMSRTVEALNRVNRALSEENLKTFNSVLSDGETVTVEAREREAIIADAQRALQSIEQTSQDISSVSKSSQNLVDGDAQNTLASVNSAADEIKAATKDARRLVSRLQGPTTDFTTNELPQLTSAVLTLQTTAENLSNLTTQIKQDPRAVISKAPAKQLDVKP